VSARCATLWAVTDADPSHPGVRHEPALSADELVRLGGGRLLARSERAIRGGAVDSRAVEPGQLFVALPGERTDGHRFVSDAVARGAAAVLVTRPPDDLAALGDVTVIRVADITFGGKSAAKVAKKADDEAKTERTRVEEAAAAQAAKDAELAAKLAVGADAEKKATKTEAKPKTATKAKAETTTAKTETAPASKTATKSAAPKKTAAKADADAPAAKAAAPKKPRATKKDE